MEALLLSRLLRLLLAMSKRRLSTHTAKALEALAAAPLRGRQPPNPLPIHHHRGAARQQHSLNMPEKGVRMLLAAALAPAGLVVLAARSSQPIFL